MAHDFLHLALFVTDLEEAEAFYQATLGLQVLFREVTSPDGEWYTLRHGTGWEDVAELDVTMGMVALQRDGVTLAIFPGDPQPGTVLEIGITVSPEEVDEIDRRLPKTATRIEHEHGDLFFADPFGFRWHVTATGDQFLSNGETTGRWLDL